MIPRAELFAGEPQNSPWRFAVGIVRHVGSSSHLHFYFKTGCLHGLKTVMQLTSPKLEKWE